MKRERYAGAAVATPLNADLSIDVPALLAHVTDLRARGLDMMTLFGTTGEGASFTRAERIQAIEACAAAGFRPDALGCGSFPLTSADAAEDARAVFTAGCGHVLLAPPLYYKGVDDEGLYRWFSETIEGIGPNPGAVVLYHIPSVTQIPLGLELIQRLAAAFPGTVAGVKDSSGDWPYTERLIKGRGDLKILVGHDGQVEKGLATGSSGTIAGSANVLPEIINALVHQGASHPNMGPLIDELLTYPIIPAVKALIAHRQGSPSWLRVRPPFTELPTDQVQKIGERLDTLFPA